MDGEINYEIIAEAIKYYKRCNYYYIDVPWYADADVLNATNPTNNKDIERGLLYSGEQGFLQLLKEKNLGYDYYVTCTPCFRPTDKYLPLHREHFMKVELFCRGTGDTILNNFIDDAFGFYSKYTIPEIIQTGDSEYDIIDHRTKTELGSYGIRKNSQFGEWVYGTGCAEPRLSLVLNYAKIQ